MYLYNEKEQEFGGFLKDLREAYGYTKVDIAKMLSVKAPAISQLEETGRGIGIDRLIYLAEFYELELENFFNGRANILETKKDIRILESVCKNNRIDTNLINEDNKEKVIKAYIRLESFLLDGIKSDKLKSEAEIEAFNDAANYFDFKIFENEGSMPFNHNLIYEVISDFKDDIEDIYLNDTLDFEIIDLCGNDYSLLRYYLERIPKERLNNLFTNYLRQDDKDNNVLVAFAKCNAMCLVDGKIDPYETVATYGSIINKIYDNEEEVE